MVLPLEIFVSKLYERDAETCRKRRDFPALPEQKTVIG
jgi:hypothetical protein